MKKKISIKGMMNIVVNNNGKEPQFESGETENKKAKGLYGLDPDTSLLSVNYATTENPYLSEHYNEESKEVP
ncbi:hypothetical protein [Peribacillus glennii]|nr:hypothetical protein [Peribacillus glennii]